MPYATLLRSEKDISWLFETHLKAMEDKEWARNNCKAFIIIGNLDSPSCIELYNCNPTINTQPFYKEWIPVEKN